MLHKRQKKTKRTIPSNTQIHTVDWPPHTQYMSHHKTHHFTADKTWLKKKLNHHITQKITDNNHHSNANIISRHFSTGNVPDKTSTQTADEIKTRQNRP